MSTDTGRDPCHLHLHPFIIIAEVLPSLPVTVFTHPVTHTHKCESFSTFVVQDWSFFWYYALFPNSNSINNSTNEYSSFGLTIIITFGNIVYQVDIDNITSLKFRMEGSNKYDSAKMVTQILEIIIMSYTDAMTDHIQWQV